MTKIHSGLGWRRQDIRSLGTWHFAEKVAKKSGIMALAVIFGVTMFTLMNTIKLTLDTNQSE
jgi:cell division protein FtsX